MSQKTGMDRRQFIQYSARAAVLGMGFPHIVPSSVLGRTGSVLPATELPLAASEWGGWV